MSVSEPYVTNLTTQYEPNLTIPPKINRTDYYEALYTMRLKNQEDYYAKHWKANKEYFECHKKDREDHLAKKLKEIDKLYEVDDHDQCMKLNKLLHKYQEQEYQDQHEQHFKEQHEYHAC